MTLEDSDVYISLSELKNEIRKAFQSLSKPDIPTNVTPPIPNADTFKIVRSDALICEGNTQAISIDIEDGDELVITFCSLLEFKLEGDFDASGLLDSIEDKGLMVDVTGDFALEGSLMFGAQITVGNGISIEFDPITAELGVDGGVSRKELLHSIHAAYVTSLYCLLREYSQVRAEVGFGMIKAVGKGGVVLDGLASLGKVSSQTQTSRASTLPRKVELCPDFC